MTKQREAFEKWAKSEYPKYSPLYFEWTEQYSHYVLDEVQFAFEAWQAAQEDKLEFARQCVVAALAEAIDTDACDVNVFAIIAKVEQEQ